MSRNFLKLIEGLINLKQFTILNRQTQIELTGQQMFDGVASTSKGTNLLDSENFKAR